MRLYHGSTVIVRAPSILKGRKTTDFGKGFYTTTSFEQAARWAKIRKDRNHANRAVVSVYEFYDEVLGNTKFDVMHYHSATAEWLNFVVANRRNSTTHHYDLVMGPVANDSLYATITMYEKGDLSVEAAVVQLKTHVLFDQLSFHSKKALKHLHFIEEKIIE